MTFREKLLADIQIFIKQNKWEQTLSDLLHQILEVKPQCPYTYLQKKVALRSKFDNTKSSSCLCELAMYCSHINPQNQSANTIKNKILTLYIDKYQHTKIRKPQCLQIVNLILFDCSIKEKQAFIKKIIGLMDYENNNLLNINEIAEIYYFSIVYSQMMKQISNLDDLLNREGQSMSIQVLKQYLQTVNENSSILKKYDINERLQGNGDLYHLISDWAISMIKIG